MSHLSELTFVKAFLSFSIFKVLANEKHLKDEMIYLLPYTTAEIGFLHLQQENYEQVLLASSHTYYPIY